MKLVNHSKINVFFRRYVKIRGRRCIDDDVTRSSFNHKKIPCPDRMMTLLLLLLFTSCCCLLVIVVYLLLLFTCYCCLLVDVVFYFLLFTSCCCCLLVVVVLLVVVYLLLLFTCCLLNIFCVFSIGWSCYHGRICPTKWKYNCSS